MFQLLGVGPVGMAKTRFGKRRRKKIRRASSIILVIPFACPWLWQFISQMFVSALFLCEHCFFGNKVLGNIGRRETVHLII